MKGIGFRERAAVCRSSRPTASSTKRCAIANRALVCAARSAWHSISNKRRWRLVSSGAVWCGISCFRAVSNRKSSDFIQIRLINTASLRVENGGRGEKFGSWADLYRRLSNLTKQSFIDNDLGLSAGKGNSAVHPPRRKMMPPLVISRPLAATRIRKHCCLTAPFSPKPTPFCPAARCAIS